MGNPTHLLPIPNPDMSDEELAEIGMILGLHCDVDMSIYKDKCMKRRVAIRMRATGCGSVGEYCDLLRHNRSELSLLHQVLTINVSHFLRNPSLFQKLASQVLPELFDAAPSHGNLLRIVSLGCAGGEEPYGLALLVREHCSERLQKTGVSIIGVDVDRTILAAAESGEFGEERLREVNDDLRNRYFVTDGRRFRVTTALRELVTFVQGDISRLDSYPPSDLLLCRNTLIYFNQPVQERILGKIADSIRPGGYLVLGKSEALTGDSRQNFQPVCLTERIYRRI